MKTYRTGGLLAIALLCLLPRVSALTTTQTTSFSGALQSGDRNAISSAIWSVDRFSTSLGDLQSVSITLQSTGTAVVSTFPLLSPFGDDPYMAVFHSVIGYPTGPLSWYANPPPMNTASVVHTFQFDQGTTFALLNSEFIGEGQVDIFPRHTLQYSNYAALLDFQSSTIATLTYSYTSQPIISAATAPVPDSGGIAVVAISLTFLAAIRRLLLQA